MCIYICALCVCLCVCVCVKSTGVCSMCIKIVCIVCASVCVKIVWLCVKNDVCTSIMRVHFHVNSMLLCVW